MTIVKTLVLTGKALDHAIARAMGCFVTLKLGDRVDTPEDLL